MKREKMAYRLKKELDAARYAHTLGVEKTAREMAEKFGVDEEKAALLGLLTKVNADWQSRYRGAIQDWNPHGHGPHGGERQRGEGDA